MSPSDSTFSSFLSVCLAFSSSFSQYYCCKQNGSDPDSPSYSEAQFSCDVCRPPGMDVSPEVAPSSCPTCSSFYSNSFYFRNRDETRNGAERIAYMLPSTHGTSLSSHTFPDFYCNTHAISTDVWAVVNDMSWAVPDDRCGTWDSGIAGKCSWNTAGIGFDCFLFYLFVFFLSKYTRIKKKANVWIIILWLSLKKKKQADLLAVYSPL